MLREGQSAVALAGAADSMLNPLGLGGFSLLRVLSDENDRPQQACRPFDATRQGTVLGEGAAFLVLETLEHAADRGAFVYAEVLGYGSSMDAFAVSDPDPAGRGAVQMHATGHPLVGARSLPDRLRERPRDGNTEERRCRNGRDQGGARPAGLRDSGPCGQVDDGAHDRCQRRRGSSRCCLVPRPPHRSADDQPPDPDPACDLDYVPDVARPFAGRRRAVQLVRLRRAERHGNIREISAA